METEKVFLTIGIFSVLLAGLFFLSAFDVNLTGKVIDSGNSDSNVQEQKQAITISCKDSDSGKEYGIKGIVEYCDESGCSNREDSCYGKTLTEWYCNGDNKDYSQIRCDNECDVGACVVVGKKIVTGSGGGGGDSGSSGGSGGGSSSVPEPTGNTYTIGNLVNEENLDMAKYDIATFSISGKDYVLNMKNVADIQITATVSSTQFDLQVGSEIEIDLDGDSDKDLNVKLKSINLLNNNAKITLRAI